MGRAPTPKKSVTRLPPKSKWANVVPIRPEPCREVRHGRRAGETDDAHALRERFYAAIDFARALVQELEDVRAIAEGEPVLPHRRAIAEKAVGAVEAAYAAWMTRGGRAPLVIGAAKHHLERARTWHAAYARGERGVDVMVDMVKAGAVRDAPELAAIPVADWQRAIEAFPQAKRGRGGDHPTRPTPWYVVVFELLEPHGLTGTKNAKTMLTSYEQAAKKKLRRRAK